MIYIQQISWGLAAKNNGNDNIKFDEEYLKQKRNGKGKK